MMKNQSMEDSVSANAVYKYMYNFPQLAAVEFNISAIINEFPLVFIYWKCLAKNVGNGFSETLNLKKISGKSHAKAP